MKNWMEKPISRGMAISLIVVGVAQISVVLADMNECYGWTKKIKERFSKKEDETVEENSSDENAED